MSTISKLIVLIHTGNAHVAFNTASSSYLTSVAPVRSEEAVHVGQELLRAALVVQLVVVIVIVGLVGLLAVSVFVVVASSEEIGRVCGAVQ